MSKWIKLSDKQPQCYQRVLCYRPDKFTVIGKTTIDSSGCAFECANGIQLLGVTHWMPLPEPPK